MMKQEEADAVPMHMRWVSGRDYDTDTEYTKYNGNIDWWLRSPGHYGYDAAEVSSHGWVDRYGNNVDRL